jgi:hypothetical protein
MILIHFLKNGRKPLTTTIKGLDIRHSITNKIKQLVDKLGTVPPYDLNTSISISVVIPSNTR